MDNYPPQMPPPQMPPPQMQPQQMQSHVQPPPTAPRRSYFGAIGADARSDLRSRRGFLVLFGGLVLCGVAIGVVWGICAPRDEIRVVDGGYALLNVNAEARVGGDVVLLLMLTGLAILATVLSWIFGPRRGLLGLVCLALGLVAAGAAAVVVGQIVSPAPSDAQLATVGAVLQVPQKLHSLGTLAIAPAIATLLYLVISLFSSVDDLSRKSERSVVPGVATDLPGVDWQRPQQGYQPDLPPQQRVDRPEPGQV